MSRPLQHWMEAARFGSKSQLARALLEDVPNLFPKTAQEQRHRRVSLQLTRLEQGTLSWWRSNPEALRALTRRLRIPEQVLLEGEVPGERFEFDEFPELRPLDPLSELPPEGTAWLSPLEGTIWHSTFAADEAPGASDGTARHFDLFRSPPEPESFIWLQVPSGAGKSLAAHLRRIRGQAESQTQERGPRPVQRPLWRARGGWPELPCVVRSVSRLIDLDLSEISPEAPLFIDVGSADPQTDLEGLRALWQWKSVIVAAPFQRPGKDWEDTSYDAEWLSVLRGMRSKDFIWTPKPGWRRELLTWAEARVDERHRKLRSKELSDWLDQFDPEERLVRTPAELLALNALANELGQRRLSRLIADGGREDIVRAVVPRLLRLETGDDSGRAAWLRAAGAEAVRTLTLAAFRDVASRWPPSAMPELWATRLPENYAAPLSDQRLDEKLLAIARGRSERERRQRAQDAKASIRPLSPAIAIEYLASTCLMRTQSDGGLGPAPHWLVELLARQYASEGLLLSPATWGRWAADPGRQRILDDVLDSLPPQRLLLLTKQSVQHFEVRDLGAVGAVEGLFSAWGRRFEKRAAELGEPPELQALARCQLDVLRLQKSDAPNPLSRAGLDAPSSTWLADCWSWSFAVPPLEEAMLSEWPWLFPGWTSPSLEAKGLWVLDFAPPPGSSAHARLAARAGEVLERSGSAPLPSSIPPLLRPSLLVWAARRGVELEPPVLATFIQGEGFVKELLRVVQAADTELQRTVASVLLHGLAKSAKGVTALFKPPPTLPSLSKEERPIPPELTQWIASVVDEASIIRAVEEAGPGPLPYNMREIPFRILLPVVRHHVKHYSGRLSQFANYNRHSFRPEHVPLLELLVDSALAVRAAYSALIDHAPELAFQKAFDHKGQYAVLSTVVDRSPEVFPSAWHPRLMDALDSCPWSEWPAWAGIWLERRIRSGGAHAERAYQLYLRWKSSAR